MSLKISKIDAATRQLDTAIELWFTDGDAVSIHTLACAAYQVIHDINSARQGRDLLFDSLNIKDEYRKQYINRLKKPMNFFKHADSEPHPEATVDLNPEMTVLFIIFSALGIQLIGGKNSDRLDAFMVWVGIHQPDWLTPVGQQRFAKAIPVEDIPYIQSIPRSEFLHDFLTLRRRTNGNNGAAENRSGRLRSVTACASASGAPADSGRLSCAPPLGTGCASPPPPSAVSELESFAQLRERTPIWP